MTREDFLKEANVVLKKFKDADGINIMLNLYSRWMDEREYEDINEYKDVMVKSFPFIEITNVHKRPFGFTFNISKSTLRIKVTSKSIDFSYKFKE